jgi:hypothetical protein
MELAVMRGWLLTHFRPAMTAKGAWVTPLSGSPGFPDLVLVRGPRLVFVELKSQVGRLTKEQLRWQEALLEAGAEHYVWRPMDWLDGTVETALARFER